jgi:hypothetical protein
MTSSNIVCIICLHHLFWHLKPPLAPLLTKHGLEWTDVVPVLEAVASIDELKKAVMDPAGFLERSCKR